MIDRPRIACIVVVGWMEDVMTQEEAEAALRRDHDRRHATTQQEPV